MTSGIGCSTSRTHDIEADQKQNRHKCAMVGRQDGQGTMDLRATVAERMKRMLRDSPPGQDMACRLRPQYHG